ncbi:hypothetical protein [Brevundimonas diminuta]|uniref:hypothetical protein n=1 Tax=Brevundimonas diminuta TaxID=293 RepID=UPI0030FBD32C
MIAVLVHQGGDFAFYGQRILAALRQRRHHHSLDQTAHQVPCFSGRLAVAAMQRLGEVDHHAAIMLCDPRMQGHRRGRFLSRQFSFQSRALGLKRRQLLLDRRAAQDAVGDLVDQAL